MGFHLAPQPRQVGGQLVPVGKLDEAGTTLHAGYELPRQERIDYLVARALQDERGRGGKRKRLVACGVVEEPDRQLLLAAPGVVIEGEGAFVPPLRKLERRH